MSFYLQPYQESAGLDYKKNLPLLECLRDQGRHLLSSHAQGGDRGRFNPKDFALSSFQANTSGADKMLSHAGKAISRQIAICLDWSQWLNPERLDHLNWIFFYLEGGEPTGAPLFTETWHTGGSDPGEANGIWLPNAELAPFELVGQRGQKGRAYCADRAPFNQADRIEALVSYPGNEIIDFEGNVCVDFPEIMCHRRKHVELPAGVVRYGFRANP